MQYFMGIDSGGTKTNCLLTDAAGKRLAFAAGPGASHRHCGVEQAVQIVANLAQQCVTKASIAQEQVAAACFALPLYGEDAVADRTLQAGLAERYPVTVLVNDTEAGWAGSLACGAGINLVSGTGSIAYGKNESGQAMRSGGWSEVFGDEGSSYWLGIKCMQLFSKQADGREKKDALYNLVRERYPMKTDFEFAVMAHRDWLPHRDKVAQFQTLLSDAADAGDVMAREMYEQAAAELAQLAVAVKAGLHFHDAAVTVSYSGGTFRAGEKLLMPLGRWLQQEGMVLRKPILTPVEGAVLLAVSACPQHSVAGVCAGLQRDAAL